MRLIDQFIDVFKVWKIACPYLQLFASREEMELVVVIGQQVVSATQVATLLDISLEDASKRLNQAYHRSILDKTSDENNVACYTITDFGHLLDYCAKYDPAWDILPVGVRRALDHHFLEESLTAYRPRFEQKRCGKANPRSLPNDTVMLLSEVEEMIDAATHIVVQPCDCRRLGQNCSRPVETCIWLDERALEALDRGQGRRLTATEAKQLLKRADKKGLMHTADGDWRVNGLHEICNCCACDCYPFRAAQALGSKGVWPQSRYLANHRTEVCTHCGACVKRCHFDAFYHDELLTVTIKNRLFKAVRYDARRCWGCGLCANSCPTNAITMAPLARG